MPMRWSYLANLGPDDKLDWGGSWSGNIPASGHVLPDIEDTGVYLKIRDHARSGNYEGVEVDWGAYAIKVNGPDLLQILSECFAKIDTMRPDSIIGRYVTYAKSLGHDKYIALLSVEL